jgi:hypothetical protein
MIVLQTRIPTAEASPSRNPSPGILSMLPYRSGHLCKAVVLLHFSTIFLCFGSGMFLPDPGSIFSIPDPGSKRSRIRIIRISVFLTKKIVSNLSGSGMFIPDPDIFPIPDPGVKKHRIPIRNTAIFVRFFAYHFLELKDKIKGRPNSLNFFYLNTANPCVSGSATLLVTSKMFFICRTESNRKRRHSADTEAATNKTFKSVAEQVILTP